jgi:hypothetical protein
MKAGELLEIDLDTVLKNLDEDLMKHTLFPCPTMYCTALLYGIDITALPRTLLKCQSLLVIS